MARSVVAAGAVPLAFALIAAPFAAEAITCGDVASELRPCIPYATGRGPISAACCSGVRALSSASSTPADRRTACSCIKSTASAVPGVNGTVLSGIPGKCGVSVPHAISRSTDCSKVK